MCTNDERFLIKERPPKNNAKDILDIEKKLSEIKNSMETISICDVTSTYIQDLREKLIATWNLMLIREVWHPEVNKLYKETYNSLMTLEKTYKDLTTPIRLSNKMVTFKNR